MHIMTVLGTRPEIIRLSLIMKKLDEVCTKHTVVYTGQNFTHSLSDVFFEQLSIRKPDYHLHMRNMNLGGQLASMYDFLEEVLKKDKPDRVLILGDTNSALSAILFERYGIPVYHMEAGNRCFDLRVPEEKNRRVVDAVSSYNLPYTEKSRQNLLDENVPVNRIFLSGNPINEVIMHYRKKIQSSDILTRLSLAKKDYFLATIHRAENVDSPEILKEIFTGFNQLAEIHGKRIICSLHPRTNARLSVLNEFELNSLVELHEPFGLFDFVKLEENAACVLTDSGTVQEECCILHVPAVTVRDATERPETVECGSNILSGTKADSIVESVGIMMKQALYWELPQGYQDRNVSQKVINYLLGVKGVV
ncbi:non-hydrolyzing UDP-N-acetylglucosamine 2-epimerase [Gracilibacillus sp. Marseille-QA3620]